MFLNLIKIRFLGMHFSLNRQVRFQVAYSVILDTIETNQSLGEKCIRYLQCVSKETHENQFQGLNINP